jgi:tetratricopeptide (TPR) repeat protein
MTNQRRILITVMLLMAMAQSVPAMALPPDFSQVGEGARDLAEKCWGEHGEPLQAQADHCTDAINSGAFTPEGAIEILIHRSEIYYKLGQPEHEMADVDLAVAVAPRINKRTLASAYNGRCWARAMSGQELDKALTDCNAALQIVSDNADFLDSRGFAHFRMADYPAALADYSAALAINPKLASSLYVRGLTKLKTGDTAGGNADISAAKAMDSKVAETYASYGVKP